MSDSSIDRNESAPPGPASSGESLISNAVTTGARWPAIVALLLGAVIILGVGFGPGITHSAAHDTRHTMAFPCH